VDVTCKAFISFLLSFDLILAFGFAQWTPGFAPTRAQLLEMDAQ
jgi:hypothetical protein